ncbi:MAG: D-sedoheptulose-7-phosphate isomerase [Chloroflexota bacterium]
MFNLAFDTRKGIKTYLSTLSAVLDTLSVEDTHEIITYIQTAYENNQQIFVVGNGGSASTASHMACDLGKTVRGVTTEYGVRRMRAVALTDNVALLTAWGNDASYDVVFSEQLRTHGSPNDLLIVITASGNSPNIVEAVKAARDLGMRSVGLLGFSGGKVKDLVDHSVVVGSNDYGQVEDAHMVLTHAITAHFQQVCRNQ